MRIEGWAYKQDLRPGVEVLRAVYVEQQPNTVPVAIVTENRTEDQIRLSELAAEALEHAVGTAYARGYERAQRDATEWLDERLNKMAAAIRVLTEDPRTGAWLRENDPMALRQAEEALR